MQPRIKSILKIVLSGGDADTNAAVAGAILGAKFGICHIPDEWRNGLLYASMLHDKVQEFICNAPMRISSLLSITYNSAVSVCSVQRHQKVRLLI